MDKDAAADLLEIVQSLERDANVTAAHGLPIATKLLRMARLDLLCRLHGISDGELQAIGDGAATNGPGLKIPH